MNIKVKFPNGHSLDFQCPLTWTSDQILYFASNNQSFYDQEKLQIYFAGALLNGGEKLEQLIKNALPNIQPTFLIVIDKKKQEDYQLQKQLLYAEYIRNVKILQVNQQQKSNYVQLLQDTAMNFKFRQPPIEIEKKKSHSRGPNNRDSPQQKELFFHFKMIVNLVLFYFVLFPYYEGYDSIVLTLAALYYWVQYQEFRAQLQRQQQQVNQRQSNVQQQQPQQQQQQQEQQQHPQKVEVVKESQVSEEKEEQEKLVNEQNEDGEITELLKEDDNDFQAFEQKKESLQDYLKRKSAALENQEIKQKTQEIQFTEEKEEEIKDEQQKTEQQPLDDLDSENLDLKKIVKKKRVTSKYIFDAIFELVYCYLMSIIPSWHVGLYQQQQQEE